MAYDQKEIDRLTMLQAEIDAHYAVSHGGCPSWNDIGTEVDLELTREP